MDTMNIISRGDRVDAGQLLIEAAGTWGWGRGVVRELVLVLLQPLRNELAKLLTQLK